jgi:hypothetical protein
VHAFQSPGRSRAQDLTASCTTALRHHRLLLRTKIESSLFKVLVPTIPAATLLVPLACILVQPPFPPPILSIYQVHS